MNAPAGPPGAEEPAVKAEAARKEGMSEAARLARGAVGFLSATRTFNCPGPGGPRPAGLNGAETARLLELLSEVADSVSGALNGIRCHHAVPAEVKPDLGELTAEITVAASRIRSAAGGRPLSPAARGHGGRWRS